MAIDRKNVLMGDIDHRVCVNTVEVNCPGSNFVRKRQF